MYNFQRSKGRMSERKVLKKNNIPGPLQYYIMNNIILQSPFKSAH